MSDKETIVPPSSLSIAKDKAVLRINWPDGHADELTAEQLRVWSPSAEVQGHGPGQAVLQTGKRHVKITGVEPVGRYAIRLTFDDGHNTGIYSWSFLRRVGAHRDEMWSEYLRSLADAGASRDKGG